MLGRFDHTIDAKGRVIIPAKFRDEVGDDFIVTKGLDGCLYVYAPEEWKKLEDKLNALPLGNKNAREVKHFFMFDAAQVTVDKQGRITIPPALRRFAMLEKDVLVAGMGSCIEIWDPAHYEEIHSTEDIGAAAESLGII